MTDKYYRVKKPTFMWDEGAILKYSSSVGGKGGYEAIDELYHATELNGEYISTGIIENSPDWFERVYPVHLLTKVVYELRDKAKDLISKNYKSE